MKSTQSTRTSLWSPTIDKVKVIIIVLGAVLACSAPFVHMLFPKTPTELVTLRIQYDNNQILESEYKQKYEIFVEDNRLFGFPNARKFWYSIGKPILILYFAIYLLLIYPSISDRSLQKSTKILGLLSTFTATYFIIWTLWYKADFPKMLYYWSIGIASVTGTFVAAMVIDYRQNLRLKIEKLIHFISIDAYSKYIKKEDRPEYMKDSYEVYDELIE